MNRLKRYAERPLPVLHRWMRLLALLLATSMAAIAAAADPSVAGCAHPLRLHTSAATTPAYQRDIAWLAYVLQQNHCELLILQQETAPFSRLLRTLEIGEHDVATGLSRTPVRESFLYFSVPYTSDRLRVYRDERFILDAERGDKPGPDLRYFLQQGQPMILPLYGWYGANFEDFRQQHLNDKGWYWYSKDADALQRLRDAPQSVLVISERVLDALPAQDTAAFVSAGAPLFSDPLHIVFSRASISAAEYAHLDQAIALMLARGITPESFAAGKR